jgi:hypothetical protein
MHGWPGLEEGEQATQARKVMLTSGQSLQSSLEAMELKIA